MQLLCTLFFNKVSIKIVGCVCRASRPNRASCISCFESNGRRMGAGVYIWERDKQKEMLVMHIMVNESAWHWGKQEERLCYNINHCADIFNNYYDCMNILCSPMHLILLKLEKINLFPSKRRNWYYYSRFYCNIYIGSWCLSVGMLIRYKPCGQLD